MAFFRRAYLFLLLLRLWFAISPSYLHPDENFQGPEVIAGKFYMISQFPPAPAAPAGTSVKGNSLHEITRCKSAKLQGTPANNP